MTSVEKGIEFGSWHKLTIGGVVPSTRYSQAVALLNETVYLFGGGSSEGTTTVYHGDMFSLCLSRTSPEWKSIKQKGDVPSPREGIAVNVVDDRLYLQGGTDKEGAAVCAEGSYVFNPVNETWERLATSGMAPTAQSSSTVVSEKTMITFGGIIKGVAQNSLHTLNLDTLEWTVAQTSGSTPPPRCDHLATVMGKKMLLTGGSGSDELWFNDVHVLDITSWLWIQVDPKGGVVPSPRDYASINVIADYAVQFGGFSGASGEEECFADLHSVDFSQNNFEWKQVHVQGESLPARYAHSAFYYNSKLYVFGGQNLEEEFNDIWSISVKGEVLIATSLGTPSPLCKHVPPAVRFDPTPVPRVRYGTTTPIPAPRKVIIPAPPTTPKPRDLEELRNTYVKKITEMFDTLTERFQQLDTATAILDSEKAAFESEKKAHADLYEKQQQELDEMLKNHKQQNEEWISRMRDELDNERRCLAKEKAEAEEASAELAQQQEVFQQKSKKLDAIMRQVQGLKD